MTVRFGDFALDEEARQLRRRGTPVPLEPKAWELLALLVSRRPRALSKPQIRDVLWPGTFVSENALAGLVADVRKALGDDARTPRYVRTVHGFGYAFCGAVEGETPPPGGPSPSPCRLLWAEREIPLADGVHLLGRDAGCLVRSRSVRVSRRHARLSVEGGRVVLEDLGSRNGTLVGGRRIEGPVELLPGDTVELGPEQLVFLGDGTVGSTVTDRR